MEIMARRLTTTSYALLGLLAARPMSAYGIARQFPRSMRWSWPLSQAHLYTEPKRLAAAGLVRVKRVPAGPHRTRQEFHITPKGRRALARWMATPPALPVLNHELMLRVGFADSGTVATSWRRSTRPRRSSPACTRRASSRSRGISPTAVRIPSACI